MLDLLVRFADAASSDPDRILRTLLTLFCAGVVMVLLLAMICGGLIMIDMTRAYIVSGRSKALVSPTAKRGLS